jgi:hypothetical protein
MIRADYSTPQNPVSRALFEMGKPLLNPAARHRIRRTAGGIQLPRIDGRTVSARRYRDLVVAFETEVGGGAALTESERSTIQQAAAIALRAEELQADLVLGKPIDSDLLVRLTGTARRLLNGIKGKADDRRPAGSDDLQSYLARTYPAKADDEAADDAEPLDQ